MLDESLYSQLSFSVNTLYDTLTMTTYGVEFIDEDVTKSCTVSNLFKSMVLLTVCTAQSVINDSYIQCQPTVHITMIVLLTVKVRMEKNIGRFTT